MTTGPKNVRLWLLLALLTFGTLPAMAQQDDDGSFTLTGAVLNRANGEPIPYAAVRINHSRRGAIADAQGFFSVAVLRSDTLNFKSIGYRSSSMLIDHYLNRYTGDTTSRVIALIMYMNEDSITTHEVLIFPYNTPDEIRLALLNMPITPENAQNAALRSNVSPEVMGAFMREMPTDPEARQAVAQQRFYQVLQSQGRVGAASFDAAAAYRMARDMAKRGKAKRERIQDFWPEER